MGNLGLQYDYNYHLERIEDVKTVDLDVLAKIICTDVDFAGSEVSLEASVSLKKKQNKKRTMLFRLQLMLVSLSKRSKTRN